MDTVILLHFILIKKLNYSIKFEIDGKPIRERTSVKYLGVLLRGGDMTSRLPYFCVPLPPVSRPLFRCSRL